MPRLKVLLALILSALFYRQGPVPTVPRRSLSEGGSTPTITISPTPTPKPSITLGLVGDLGLGRHITSIARDKNDFFWSFRGISSWLKANDFNFANLESPIIDHCPTGYTGTFIFCGDTRFLPYLQDHQLGFTLANNHIFNYGQNGFSQTLQFLTDYQIPFVYSPDSTTEFTTKTINGITLGFLGYDFITNPVIASAAKQSEIVSTIKKYDHQVDWLIVSLHWGNEYLPNAEKWRVNLAHLLIDAGADIIHGHHPHVWQPEEIYKDKPIYYSLGNFIFDQSWSSATSHSNIVRLTLSKNQILSSETFPVEIKFNSQPWLIGTPAPTIN